MAVYVRFSSTGETVFALPLTYHITKSLQQVLNYELETGTIIIGFFDLVDDSVDPGTFGNVAEYRYVVIPGGTAVGASADIDLGDYSAVSDYYGIP